MYWGFIVATMLITLMPGPSLVVIMMTAIDRGLWRSTQVIAGVVLADAILLALVLSGLGAVLCASALSFTLLKWLGAAYLLYLGVQQLRSRSQGGAMAAPGTSGGFASGLATTLLNPKIIGFLIVYFPQFLQRNQSVAVQMRVLGPLFLAVVFATFLACALCAQVVRHWLESDAGRRTVARLCGASLVGCSVYSLVG